jgi:cell division protein FtsQ
MKYSKFFHENKQRKSKLKISLFNKISSIFHRNVSNEKQEFYPYFKNPLEKRRFTKSPKFQVHKLKRLTSILFFLIAVGWGGFIIKFFVHDSTYFDVREILVMGAGKFVNAEDLEILVDSNLVNRNIFYVDTQKLESDLNSNFLGAKKLSVKKVFPDKIIVSVEERKPLALLYQNPESELYLIDDEGYVLGKVAPEFMDLPKIQFSGALEIGKFVSQEIVPVTRQIIKESDANNLKISSMSFNPKYTRIYIVDSAEALISNEKDLSFSLKLLSSMVKRLTLEGKKVSQIDLRYDKVIVK